jgi:hypothetical protein
MELKSFSKKREGIGSLFNETDPKDYPFSRIKIEFDYELFYTGRQAFKYILDSIFENQTIEKIWMPNYYCQHVTRWIKRIYKNLYFYDVNPFEFNHTIDVKAFASSKDIVLVNNYWGLSDTVTKKEGFPIIIEDHSHGWLTNSCMHSNADYCFASLRKSLPIPLGGIAWKPNSKFSNSKIRYLADASFYETFDRLRGAMKEKTLYKNGSDEIVKENYLKVIEDTEDFLDENHEIIKLRNQDLELLNTYFDINFLKHKHINLKFLNPQIKDVEFMRIVKRKNHTPFGLLLLFKDKNLWSSMREYLIAHDIYPSFLWPDNKVYTDWSYLLNIHVDFRYNENDMAYIAEIINNWTKKYDN